MNLDDLKNKTILLFGKPRAFSSDEFEAQLKVHNISCIHEVNDEVSLIIDGRMMTPYEEIESEKLYELKKYEFESIDSFESKLAKYLNEDALLMSLKLSGNKERLKSFIQNTTISDELFFKLLKMYSWGGDDFFESNDNRDISAAFISRFYENIEQNHNVQYATTGYVHLIKQTLDAKLLEVILFLEPTKQNSKMKMQLAMNEQSPLSVLKTLRGYDEVEINEALSLNKNLDIEIIKEFLGNEQLSSNIAKNIKLSDELFSLLQKYQVALALNETLSLQMQEKLLKLDDTNINYALSLNDNIDLSILDKLLESENKDILLALYENKMMPRDKLELAYKEGIFYEQLAKNEATPIEILYQLHLDAKYERYVKTNASFGKNIKEENIGWL